MNIRCREQDRKSDIGLKISVNSLLIIWEKVNRMSDLIDREAMLKHIEKTRQGALMMDDIREASIVMTGMYMLEEAVRNQPSAQPATNCSEIPNGSDDTISRQAAIDCVTYDVEHTIECLKALSSAQPERDIPIKPYETTDTAWGIPHRQAVCPKCDYYLGHVAFLGDYKGKKVTYCETCGQAIDWERWDSDE